MFAIVRIWYHKVIKAYTVWLSKAYVGFCGHPKTAIATGNWGCDALKGDPKLKGKWRQKHTFDLEKLLTLLIDYDKCTEQNVFVFKSSHPVDGCRGGWSRHGFLHLWQWTSCKRSTKNAWNTGQKECDRGYVHKLQLMCLY